jgi:hypothetical protein
MTASIGLPSLRRLRHHDGTLLYSSDAGHGDDVALVNNPISEGEAA